MIHFIEEKSPSRSTLLVQRLWIPFLTFSLCLGICLALAPLLPKAQFAVQQSSKNHPILRTILPPTLKPPDSSPPLTGNWLLIPSINVREKIWDGPSLDVLWTHDGVWHQVGDLQHNLVLAGHRFQYLPPNTQTFYNLDKLHTGDNVTVVWEGISHQYLVQRSQVLTPDHVEVLNQTQDPELTLYTCNDWEASRRLVVLAKPIN
jgi:LPXTG-site transpeptidase (sortase) family protein